MYFSVFDGVCFVEGRPPGARLLVPISVEVGGNFEHAQLKTLDDVMRAMVPIVIRGGGNAVISFAYGQKSVGFLRSIVHLDDVAWYGRGTIAVISHAVLR